MRQITITLYQYAELPTEEAKKRARDWWIDGEMQDPAWLDETRESCNAAVQAARDCTLADLKADDCPLTGYCMDHVAIVAGQTALRDNDLDMDEVEREIGRAVNAAWEKELDSRREDSYVIDNIEANEYEFTENGDRY